jgi:hypothetical protein
MKGGLCLISARLFDPAGDAVMADRITMEFVTDPEDLARARKQREQFDRNAAWLQKHVPEIYRQHRGELICIAGEELFVGDTVQEVIAKATAAHPDGAGRFVRYIPLENVPRIYAN